MHFGGTKPGDLFQHSANLPSQMQRSCEGDGTQQVLGNEKCPMWLEYKHGEEIKARKVSKVLEQ